MDSKYKTIYHHILSGIRDNQYPRGSKIPTEYELMEMYDVSRITVRKALQELTDDGFITRHAGRGSYVGESIPAIPALPFLEGEGQHISFIVSNSVPQVLEILGGVEQTLAGTNMQVHMSVTENDPEKESAAIQTAIANKSAGILLFPCSPYSPKKALETLNADRFPLVLLDNSPLSIPSNCISTDGYGGAYDATEYLIRMGHRRIGYVSIEPVSLETVEHRFSGYTAAMTAHGLPVPDGAVVRAEAEEPFRQQVSEMLLSDTPPTAVFALNDTIAYIVYAILNDLKRRIPEDLSIVGFDNLSTSASIVPPLTTMAQPFREIGRRAGRVLLRHIKGPSEYVRSYLPVELIERASVRRLE